MHCLGVEIARLPQDELSHSVAASIAATQVSNTRSHTKGHPPQRVRPAALAAYTSSSEGAALLYRTGSAKAGQLYETVSPVVQPYVDYAAVQLRCPAEAQCSCWSIIICIHLASLMCTHRWLTAHGTAVSYAGSGCSKLCASRRAPAQHQGPQVRELLQVSVNKVVKHPHIAAAKQRVLASVHAVTDAPPVRHFSTTGHTWIGTRGMRSHYQHAMVLPLSLQHHADRDHFRKSAAQHLCTHARIPT